MKCTECKREVSHLVFRMKAWLCSICATTSKVSNGFTGRTWQNAGNKYKPWMTKADADMIRNRIVSPDDGRTVIDRRTGRPTQLVMKHR